MIVYPKQIDGLEPSPADDGFLIYFQDTDRVHYLNHIATLVLLLCDGKNSNEDIPKLLQQQYDLPEAPIDDVDALLNQFVDEGLIVLNVTTSA
ncbi:hypothetical protein AU255_06100 [Methyloprofundus sedimenti]|uniref:Uncharacterized protein n=1 Tax=Methyloprofundus sedimenti TaxID=1420851 RepID=A0A1V8M7F1_9GAMM|nr:PqqD family protein [Methyloprofundus sedimenti]OQK17448.1 hypothetical protein AU255_06100 [Methyloprofundus sedimenti]